MRQTEMNGDFRESCPNSRGDSNESDRRDLNDRLDGDLAPECLHRQLVKRNGVQGLSEISLGLNERNSCGFSVREFWQSHVNELLHAAVPDVKDERRARRRVNFRHCDRPLPVQRDFTFRPQMEPGPHTRIALFVH